MKTIIRIGRLDAALVLRVDGTIESWLPHVHHNPPENAIAASALMFAYTDGRPMAKIYEAMRSAGREYLDPPPNSRDRRPRKPRLQ